MSVNLDENQRAAVRMAVDHGLSILCGGPGTGKSTVTRAIVEALLPNHPSKGVLCLAPTAKAVDRLKRVLGSDLPTTVLTVDKALVDVNVMDEYRGGAVLMDEASMAGAEMLAALCRDLEPTHLVLVGDQHQLPPVDDDVVFPFLMQDPLVPHVELTHVYRQNRTSGLYRTIQHINAGENAIVEDDSLVCCWGTPLLSQVRPLLAQRTTSSPPLPQFICLTNAMRTELNTLIQTHVNPRGAKLPLSWMDVREGDPVVCVKNLYADQTDASGVLLVANGTPGRVMRRSDGKFVIKYPGYVDAPGGKGGGGLYATRFELAYCITAHKSQGDEFPHVVLVLDVEGFKSAGRELLYTGISRARESCTIVASGPDQVREMIRRVPPPKVSFPPLKRHRGDHPTTAPPSAHPTEP